MAWPYRCSTFGAEADTTGTSVRDDGLLIATSCFGGSTVPAMAAVVDTGDEVVGAEVATGLNEEQINAMYITAWLWCANINGVKSLISLAARLMMFPTHMGCSVVTVLMTKVGRLPWKEKWKNNN
jgi:hypothetical protein